jgi:predicted NBD/HSP70 family sugar kinase
LLHAVRNCCSALARRENLHCREVLDAAREGDKEIVEVLRTVGRYLGIAIANLANIFNPAKVVLSGHLARAAHFMMAPVEEEMRNRVFQGMNCDLEVSGCLEDLEVRAALSAFLSNYCR